MNEETNFQVPPQVAKTLTQLTDEPRLEVALRLVLKDALEYRLGRVKEGLLEFQKKYGANFTSFKKNWLAKKIPNRHSYPVERDFWEWEGLTSRLAILNRLKKWL